MLALIPVAAILLSACVPDPDRERLERTVGAVYDEDTGRLEQITYDSNDNGVVDIWSYMNGTQVLRIEIDKDEDGAIERWEYYDEQQRLEKVGFSRANDGIVDAWAYEGPDGRIARVEVSTVRDGVIDRWEYYENDVLVRAEEDLSDPAGVDKWETYIDGRIGTVSFDETGDGRADRRLTYGAGGVLLSIESEPDGAGGFRNRIEGPTR